MSAVGDPQVNAPSEGPGGSVGDPDTGAYALPAPATHPPGEDPRQIRVPRLLVAASEISWRFLVCLAAGAVVVFALTRVGFAVIPVVIALLLSTLLVPAVAWLVSRRLPRTLAAVLVFLGALLLLMGILSLLIAPVASDFETLNDQVRVGADKLGGQIASLPLGLEEREVQRQIDRIDDRIRENSGAIGNGVVSGAQAAGQFLAGLIITLVVLFFFLKDGAAMWRWTVNRVPAARKPALDELGQRSWDVLSAYVRGVVFVATFDAVGIGLALFAIGVPLVLPLAMLTFLLAFIPLVGAIVAGAAAALVALAFEGVGAALLVLLAVVVVQQVEGNVLYPMIVGRRVDLHPVAVLLAVTVGGLLYGVVGAALAVPIAVVAAAAVATVERHAVHGEVAVGPSPAQQDAG